jgi:hypothetical protein
MPGEAIRLTSPFLHRPIILSADAEGSAAVTWSCDPGAARTVAVTAWGADGRRSITFPVTGVSEQGAPSVAAIDAQERVDDAADIVLDAVDSLPDTAAGEGFAGVVVSPDHGEVDLYWKGVPPEAVTDAIERATSVTGIRVAARPAALTRHHLLERAHALVTDDRTLPLRGDSGGPVFTLTNDGGVEARGTIAGGSREVACGRHHPGACTANVFFVDIEPALDQHHAELVTTNARA